MKDLLIVFLLQVSSVTLLSAQEHHGLLKKVYTQGYTIYYQKHRNDKLKVNLICFYLNNRFLNYSDSISNLTDRDIKLQELDYMKETHLLIDSIRETITQLVGKKTITSLQHHLVDMILIFDNDGKIFNVGIVIPSSIYGKRLRKRQIYTILNHIHSRFPVFSAYAKLNKLQYQGGEMYHFPLFSIKSVR